LYVELFDMVFLIDELYVELFDVFF